jgi:hypothetical protein
MPPYRLFLLIGFLVISFLFTGMGFGVIGLILGFGVIGFTDMGFWRIGLIWGLRGFIGT